MSEFLDFTPGQNVSHPELGMGVFLGREAGGYARVFFQHQGERQVSLATLVRSLSWNEQVVSHISRATPDSTLRLWLALEAEQLPLLENAATLTAAKVDLLPHQIVLTYKVANSSPRRFLIADSVGLGKTIETALILRELASRGELTRALMIVPAGLVENWRRELNETFHLDFEVFGSEGDVTDRRSNAFAKHNRMIASIDTLKRRERVKRLLQSPPWDLIVFDEAHHLTAYSSGTKVTKTQNFKLAEAMREHTRDMLLLSATPHQGDHFRFWMLVRLLSPSMFYDTKDMIENRHRLNGVVFRRTQADACNANGEPLFARRQVHTQAFHLSEPEANFYRALMEYLRDGYDLAAVTGSQGRALGFVMTIFQKIAASSFAAVRSTLHRRLLNLTIHEAIVCDENLDVDGRERALADARELIAQMYELPAGTLGRAEADRIVADCRVHLLRKLGERVERDVDGSEIEAAGDEDTAAMLVAVALPEERKRIQSLLGVMPTGLESKTQELLRAFADLWAVHPGEKIVIFTTYLGSVDALRDAIDSHFPEAGVEVLKGGDHGAKTAAEKRFRKTDGPRVLVCTAAGREGINLQFARVLFNHDLPWNPMDLEQRIGRIHRYGQAHTAQVYNLVSSDTIEGSIFLMLEEKLLEIAKAVGKVDELGQVAEDLRGQILGQLSERLSYDKLYQDAVRDPTLKRTRQELEVALENARTAREVVFELFQDLDGFRLDDYRQFDDGGQGMQRLFGFVDDAVRIAGGRIADDKGILSVVLNGSGEVKITTDREIAKGQDSLTLLGLEHPLVKTLLDQHRKLKADARAVAGKIPGRSDAGVLTVWHVEVHGIKGQYLQRIVAIGLNSQFERFRPIERQLPLLRRLEPSAGLPMTAEQRIELARSVIPDMVRRELFHQGTLSDDSSLSLRLLAWIELGAAESDGR